MQGQGGAWTKGGVAGRVGTRDVRAAGEGRALWAWRRWGRALRRGEVETGMAGAGRASGRWRYVCCGGRCAERRRRCRGCECRSPVPRHSAGLSPAGSRGLPDSGGEPWLAGVTMRLPRAGSTSVCQGRKRPARVACPASLWGGTLPGPGKWVQSFDLLAPENKTSLLQIW